MSRSIKVNSNPLKNRGKCGLPFIIKPARLGSSIGISIANDKKQAEEGFKLAFEYDNKVLVEKCLRILLR